MIFNDVKLEKRAKLIESGVNPYPYSFEQTHTIAEVRENSEALLEKNVTCYGRIMAKRGQGKVYFMDLEGFSARIQLYIKKDILGDEVFETFKKWDIGDIIGVEGTLFKTKVGELSVQARQILLFLLRIHLLSIPIQA